MSRLLIASIAVAEILISAGYGTPPQAGRATKTFHSANRRFSVEYPANWYRDASDREDLHIDTFPPAKAWTGVHVPPGHATIQFRMVGKFSDSVPTLESIVDSETRYAPSPSRKSIKIEVDGHYQPAIEVKTKVDTIAQVWYFEFHGRVFAASVVYWEDDQRGSKYIESLSSIVRSLKLDMK